MLYKCQYTGIRNTVDKFTLFFTLLQSTIGDHLGLAVSIETPELVIIWWLELETPDLVIICWTRAFIRNHFVMPRMRLTLQQTLNQLPSSTTTNTFSGPWPRSNSSHSNVDNLLAGIKIHLCTCACAPSITCDCEITEVRWLGHSCANPNVDYVVAHATPDSARHDDNFWLHQQGTHFLIFYGKFCSNVAMKLHVSLTLWWPCKVR
jgi:hypothetical protein